MDGLSAAELADLAGTTVAEVQRLADLGILFRDAGGPFRWSCSPRAWSRWGSPGMAPDEPIREDELEEVVPLLELAQSMGSLDRAGMTRIGRAWVEGRRLAATVENQEYTAGLARLPRKPGTGRWQVLEQVARLATERVPAMCFLDLAGYTRLTEERGDQAAAELAGTLAELVGRAAREHVEASRR